MFIVADSGSTKADWILADGKKIIAEFNTMGFNPFFHDEKIIVKALNENKGMKKYASLINEVYFFGAGCSSPKRNKIIHVGLQKFFTKAKIKVEHDMLGASIAACNDSAGIIAILGTGSNCCYYDGKKIVSSYHGLGYILGDEGSGSYYGKKLLTSYLYHLMPDDLNKKFYEKYNLTKEKIIKSVYQQPDANVYLASFAKFLSSYKHHQFIRALIYKGMVDFFESNIVAYPQYKKIPVHFIGSIAFHFRDILEQVAKENKFRIGKILVKPVDELVKYYMK